MPDLTWARLVAVPSKSDLHGAATAHRKPVGAAAGLEDDSPKDATLRDRLEAAADTLDGATGRRAGPASERGGRGARKSGRDR